MRNSTSHCSVRVLEGAFGVKFFDTRLYEVLQLLSDLFLLNLLWLLACLPILTIFPSTAAMFGVVRKWVQGKEGNVFKLFFSMLRANLRQSLIVGFVWMVICVVLALNFFLLQGIQLPLRITVLTVNMLVSVVLLLATVYLFPVLVNYQTNSYNVLRNAVLLSVGHLPTSFQCLLLVSAVGLILFYVPMAIILAAGSVTAYAVYWLCDRSFEQVSLRRLD